MTEPEPWALAAVEGQQLARELRERLPKDAAETSITELALARQRHESWEKRFGEVVRGWRQDRNWSQDDVAEHLRHHGFEMHQTTVAKIERGARPLRVAEATALAEVFGMPIMAVFELSLPDDHATELVSHRIELEQARKRVDDSRETLYSIAQQHASLLAEVEKIVLRMNDDVAGEVSRGSEA
ncbi:helix-turn-helix protein [Mycobacteroides salmoniphilum]|uniref:Helix-turn-helix protein n=1 Tax=Mycobacteroides salmoniphilum TaxID=404941 RepID=A0A4R8RWZ3_9MYCO|nr:helix-turn-helix transcriptional regulator [Mycobacteroides salmoniphilum]TDZ79106.1 helix-turn-helix protein [Mycobacteroides salmoniphilum]